MLDKSLWGHHSGDDVQAEVQSLHADGSIALHTRSAKYGKVSSLTGSSAIGAESDAPYANAQVSSPHPLSLRGVVKADRCLAMQLTGGDLLYVPAALVKRQKHHFTNLTTMGKCPFASSFRKQWRELNTSWLLPRSAHCVQFGPAGITMILGCNGMVWLAPTHEGSPAAASSTSAPEQTAAKAPASAAEREAVSKAANAVRLLASLSMNISPASLLNVCKVCAERGVQAKDMLTASFIGAVLEEESQQRLQTSL